MAGENEFEVIIGADGQPLTKTLSQLKNELKGFEKELQNTKDPALLTFLNKKIIETTKNMTILKSVGVKTFAGLKPGANEAANALQNVGRVAQDVPFGFIGIQNNLNPLLESFQRLKTETGSGSAALKAMAGSLIGAGGLGLALSLVSAGILIFQNGIANFSSKTKEAKDSVDDLKKSIRSLTDIQDEAVGSAEAEITKVIALKDAILDVNKSTGERKRALEDLQSVNKEVFGQYTLEASSLATLTTATEKYTEALLAQAVAKGFADEISKAAVVAQKRKRILDEAIKKQKELGDVTDEEIIATGQLGTSIQEINKVIEKGKAVDAVDEARVAVEEAESSVFDLKEGYKAANAEALKLFGGLGGGKGKTKKETDLLKQRIDVLKELVEAERQGLDKDAIFVTDAVLELKDLEIKLIRRDFKGTDEEKEKLIKLLFPDYEGGTIKLSKPIVITAPIKFKSVDETDFGNEDDLGASFEKRFPKLAAKFKKEGEKLREELLEPLKNLEGDLKNIITGGFGNIGEAIGESLAGAISPAKAFIDVIATALQQIGRALIAYGIASAAVQKALKAGIFSNPLIAIGAGIAAIAAAKLLQSQLNKSRSFAEGGIVLGPTRALIGEAGPEAVIPLSRANQFTNSTNSGFNFPDKFTVEGTDLILVLNRANANNSRRGGNG